MAQEVTIRRGNNAYTLLVESREGDIYATALKRLNNTTLSLLELWRTLTRVRVSKDYVFIYSSNIGYWVNPLSDEAPIVFNTRNVGDVQVNSNDTLCTWDDLGWVLTVRTANAEPVRWANVCSYFLHETWGPIIFFLDHVLRVSGGIRIPIPNVNPTYMHKFYWLNHRLFLIIGHENNYRSTIMEVFENRMVVLTDNFDGVFIQHNEDSPDRRPVTDLHNGTAYVIYAALQREQVQEMHGILDLNTLVVTPTIRTSEIITAASLDGHWLLNGEHQQVYSATQHLRLNLPDARDPNTTTTVFLGVQDDWALYYVGDIHGVDRPIPFCIYLVHWPTRHIFHTFVGASGAMFVDGRVLVATYGTLSWYAGHSTMYGPLVRFLYGELPHEGVVNLIDEFAFGTAENTTNTNHGEYEFKSIMLE